ncbi:iron-containing alcohol dehydrogenase [uncultured Desulfuromusa sp.]|uniref:iron-containing alcohol dehydrogenase n=1 Tax=uncultured Desulfuromusa sp. TaxID=219183 RepID=UPI002AA94ED9|nr:iron-containing alcohol dehydrogenase [uncultured Desulfuromusa sp.]
MGQHPNNHPRIVDLEAYLSGCTCEYEHPAPEVTLYSGADAAQVLAKDCRAIYGNQPVLLLFDPDTYAVAGADLQQCLVAENVNLRTYQFDSHPVATDTLIETVRTLIQESVLIISVGSGTVNDLGKYSSSEDKIDFWSVPTAPSMNGYTSGIAAIKVKGVKRTLPATPPQRIYVLPEVIQQAPLKLRQAGFCDVLAKVVSDIDWQSESLLCSGSYCGLPAAMMAEVEKSYSEHPEDIGRGDAAAVMGLFNGLLLSGVAMSLAGSSAPASGGEHLVSHFWDMREVITGREPELHGLQVGVGIILSTACYQRLRQLDAAELQSQADQVFAATAAQIPAIWGPYAAEVDKQFQNKRQALKQFDTLLPQKWDALQDLFQQVQPPEYFAELFARTGAPFNLSAFRLTEEEFILAALNSRAIRERITVLDLAANAGVLEAATEDALLLLR